MLGKDPEKLYEIIQNSLTNEKEPRPASYNQNLNQTGICNYLYKL